MSSVDALPGSFFVGASSPLATSRSDLVVSSNQSTRHLANYRSPMSENNAVSRYEEATRFIASVESPKVRAALEYALATVMMRRGMDPSITTSFEFDLRYY